MAWGGVAVISRDYCLLIPADTVPQLAKMAAIGAALARHRPEPDRHRPDRCRIQLQLQLEMQLVLQILLSCVENWCDVKTVI